MKNRSLKKLKYSALITAAFMLVINFILAGRFVERFSSMPEGMLQEEATYAMYTLASMSGLALFFLLTVLLIAFLAQKTKALQGGIFLFLLAALGPMAWVYLAV